MQERYSWIEKLMWDARRLMIFLSILAFSSGCTTTPRIIRMAEEGDSEAVIDALRNGSDVDARDEKGDTALMKAAYGGHSDMVKSLIQEGWNVYAGNIRGHTALTYAAWQGNDDIVRLLVDIGAAIDARTKAGDTALTLSAFRGHVGVVQILIDNNADIEAENSDGNNALALAAMRGHSRVVEMLLRNGAYAANENREGKTAWQLASSSGHGAIAEMLIPRFYGIPTDLEKSGEDEFVRLIIEKGMIDVRDPRFEIEIDHLNIKKWNMPNQGDRKPLRPLTSLRQRSTSAVNVGAKHIIRVAFTGRLIADEFWSWEEYIPVTSGRSSPVIMFVPESDHEYVVTISTDNSEGFRLARSLTDHRYPRNALSGSITVELTERRVGYTRTIATARGNLTFD